MGVITMTPGTLLNYVKYVNTYENPVNCYNKFVQATFTAMCFKYFKIFLLNIVTQILQCKDH